MPQNSKHHINERRAKIAELYLEGHYQQEIAKKLGVNQSQVSRDLKALSKQWQQESIESIDKIRAHDLAKLTHLERTYHDGWNRSIQEQLTEKSKETSIDGKVTKETSFERKALVGDPRFLDGVLKCISKREEILGYAAPKRLDHTSGGEKFLENKVIILPSNGRENIEQLKGGADVEQNNNVDSVKNNESNE